MTTAVLSDFEMTNRQLAGAVRFGRRVTIVSPDLDDEPEVTGYVTGFDDDNINLVVIEGDKLRNVLRHRDFIAHMEIHQTSTLSSEPLYEELEKMIRTRRDRIVAEYF